MPFYLLDFSPSASFSQNVGRTERPFQENASPTYRSYWSYWSYWSTRDPACDPCGTVGSAITARLPLRTVGSRRVVGEWPADADHIAPHAMARVGVAPARGRWLALCPHDAHTEPGYHIYYLSVK